MDTVSKIQPLDTTQIDESSDVINRAQEDVESLREAEA